MSSKLKRHYGADHLHFITFSGYHRQPWLASSRRRELLAEEPEQWTWSSYRSYPYGDAGAVKLDDLGGATVRLRSEVA